MLKRLLALLIFFVSAPAFAEEPMPPNNILRLITHQTGWLNTSRALTAEDLSGRIILLDFWTYCCINCIHVIPDLKYLEEKYGDKLTVIGVHSAKFKNEQDSENIRQAILRYGLHHPVVNDFDFSTWQGFGVRAWPTFVLINPKGMIEAMYSGEGNREKAARDIDALLKKYEGKITTAKLPMALEREKQSPSVLSFPGKLDWGRYGAKDSMDALYVSDSGHHRIVVMDARGNIVDTIGSGQEGFKDGDYKTAQFRHPQGILLAWPELYVADTENHALRKVDLIQGQVSTIAGTGKQGYERNAQNKPALATLLASPWDLAFYPDDKHIVIAMAGTHQLWSYDIAAKTVSVIAGNGSESIDDGKYPNNSLSQPSGLSAFDGKLYFVDAETSSLRVLDNGEVKTLIGMGLFDFGYKEGKRSEALMQHSIGVFADSTGVYVADTYNHSIRRYNPASGTLTNFAGHSARGSKDGVATQAEFNEPNDLLKVGDKFYVADTNNNAVRIIEAGKVSTLTVGELVKKETAQFSGQLPNVERIPDISTAADAAVTMDIGLQKGWHINEEAPSTLAVFDNAKQPVASFGVAELKAHSITLPGLKEGGYRLQTTLYYCEDKAGAQCLIKSFDVKLTAKAGGQKEISLKLN